MGPTFRNVPTVAQLGKHLAKTFPKLDILINNAAQTVKRPAAHYKSLIEAAVLCTLFFMYGLGGPHDPQP